MNFRGLSSFISGVAMVVLSFSTNSFSLENGVARTPPMGWNPWSEFSTGVTEAIFREVADSMVSKGLLKAGYVYMNQDGGGRYNNNATLGTWLRSKGFKFGMYGNNINFSLTEKQWVDKWVAAGADYVKWDAYYTNSGNATYTTVRDLLAASGRSVVFSAHWVDHSVNATTANVANMWRTTPDVYIPWEAPRDAWNKIATYINYNNNSAAFAKPGAWNDPDFLLVGLTDGWTGNTDSLTYEENKTHFSLWCISAAPLIIGTDVRDLKKENVDILTNSEVIAIDQDTLGYQGRRIKKNADGTEIWSKNLKNGDKSVLLVNFSTAAKKVSFKFSEVGMAGSVLVRDLWAHTDMGAKTDSLSIVNIPSHGSAMFRLKGESVAIKSTQQLRIMQKAQSGNMILSAGRLYNAPTFTSASMFSVNGRALHGLMATQQPVFDLRILLVNVQ
jgi:alpha-galactosidase